MERNFFNKNDLVKGIKVYLICEQFVYMEQIELSNSFHTYRQISLFLVDLIRFKIRRFYEENGYTTRTTVKITTADPSALGLFGLAMVTLVASSQKLGLTEGLSLILPWAFFLGGLAQLIAGFMDSKHNNVFGTTAFTAFGLFWFGVGMSWLIQLGAFGETLAADADPRQLGMAFIGYLIFSIFMTIGAMETHKVLFSIFVFIDFLFIGLL